MYKAKITSKISSYVYSIDIPSLGLSSVEAHLVGPKDGVDNYSKDDLVLVTRLNDKNWVIIGYIYN